jgi:hemerythrin superfamily protein
MDAITLLKQDHKAVDGLFKKFEQAGDRAHKTKRKLVDQVITELAVHAAIEEQLFYPTIRDRVESTEDEVLESLEEHHVVKWTLSELEGMDPQDERFDPKVTVLIESVRHHVKEEEGDLFPKVRKAMTRNELADLGAQMEEAKKTAPTRPHPRAPDTPPGNLVAGPMAAVMDAGRNLVRGVREGVSEATE